MKLYIYLIIFWAMQVVAQILFKWGSAHSSYWLWGFFLGNFFGMSSIWFLMLIYKMINPNIALGIAFGGAFLLSQLALALIFKSKINFLAWVGIVMMTVGMILLASKGLIEK